MRYQQCSEQCISCTLISFTAQEVIIESGLSAGTHDLLVHVVLIIMCTHTVLYMCNNTLVCCTCIIILV